MLLSIDQIAPLSNRILVLLSIIRKGALKHCLRQCSAGNRHCPLCPPAQSRHTPDKPGRAEDGAHAPAAQRLVPPEAAHLLGRAGSRRHDDGNFSLAIFGTTRHSFCGQQRGPRRGLVVGYRERLLCPGGKILAFLPRRRAMAGEAREGACDRGPCFTWVHGRSPDMRQSDK